MNIERKGDMEETRPRVDIKADRAAVARIHALIEEINRTYPRKKRVLANRSGFSVRSFPAGIRN